MFTNCLLKIISLASVLLAGSSTAYSKQPTYAELLGWPVGTKAVIFHVDDAGMSHDSNMGAIKAVEQGVATSLSIMMPCSWVPEMTAWLKQHPEVDAGIHLTHTSEWKNYRWGPVAGKAAVPGLVDSDGCLWRTVSEVAANATPDEIETEIRAQIDKLRTAGIEPTHLDSHMGACFSPLYFNSYVAIGIEEKIPILIFGGHMQHIGAQAGAFKPMVRMVAQTVWDAGLPVIDDLVTDPTRAEDYEQRKAELIKLLKEMQPGITEVIVHCTLPSETFSHISSSGPKRHAELRLMTDPDIKAFIESEGIVLTNWRELARRRKQSAEKENDRTANPEGDDDKPASHDNSLHIDVDASGRAVAELEKYLQAEPVQRTAIKEQGFAAVPLTQRHARKAEKLLWSEHVQRIKQTRSDEMEARRLEAGTLKMPFHYTVSGEMPKDGRSLYISLHGGGGAPKRVNDQQWENQKRLYRVEEGVYLAPRAPTDSWNMWHQSHIDGLFGRLIENLIVFEGVNPNRVYLLGFSAGGDGVYQLAPRMADRFAAAAMMSGHPNEASPLGLRNLAFTIHAGGKDSAYNRNKVAREWGKQLDLLQEDDPDGYVHWTKVYEDKGHWLDRKDAAALPWMAGHSRDPLPHRIVWRQDDVTHSRFYWLAVEPQQSRKAVEVRATLKGQLFDIDTDGIDKLIIRMNDSMLNLDHEITVMSQGNELYKGHIQRSIGTLAETLAERGDPASIFSGEIIVTLKDKAEAHP